MNQMTTLPEQPSTSLPIPADREAEHLIRFYRSKIGWLDGRPQYYGEQPDKPSREKLVSRLRALNEALERRNETQLQRALARLFAVTRTASADRAHAEKLVRDYSALLSELPVWAVVKACGTIARGGGESTTFAPGAPEIYRLAQEAMADVLAERETISTLLSAPVAALPRPDPPSEEELHERYGEDFGIDVTDLEAEARRKAEAAWARETAHAEMKRRRELEAEGYDPDVTPCSLALLKSPLTRKDWGKEAEKWENRRA